MRLYWEQKCHLLTVNEILRSQFHQHFIHKLFVWFQTSIKSSVHISLHSHLSLLALCSFPKETLQMHGFEFVCVLAIVIAKIRKFIVVSHPSLAFIRVQKMMCLIVYYLVFTQWKFERVSHSTWEPHMVSTDIWKHQITYRLLNILRRMLPYVIEISK